MRRAYSVCRVDGDGTMLVVNPLQELISERLTALELSQRAASLRAASLLNPNTIGRILRGETIRITDQTVAGLALALEVSQDRVRAAAEATAHPERYLSYAGDFVKLTPEQQQRVFDVMDAVLAEHAEAERKRKATNPRSKYRRD